MSWMSKPFIRDASTPSGIVSRPLRRSRSIERGHINLTLVFHINLSYNPLVRVLFAFK